MNNSSTTFAGQSFTIHAQNGPPHDIYNEGMTPTAVAKATGLSSAPKANKLLCKLQFQVQTTLASGKHKYSVTEHGMQYVYQSTGYRSQKLLWKRTLLPVVREYLETQGNRQSKNSSRDEETPVPTGNEIVLFNFKSHEVRSVIIDGEPWCVAKDICVLLEIKNTSQALKSLNTPQKGISSVYTLGGMQEMMVVNESGLYALIFKSRHPIAIEFQDWVTTDMLPTFRRTGFYSATHALHDDKQPSLVSRPQIQLSKKQQGAIPRAGRAFKALLESATASGLTFTAARELANTAVRNQFGFAPLDLLNVPLPEYPAAELPQITASPPELPADHAPSNKLLHVLNAENMYDDNGNKLFSPTELVSLVPCTNVSDVNEKLIQLGLQREIKQNNCIIYESTMFGSLHTKDKDAARVLYWRESIIDLLQQQ